MEINWTDNKGKDVVDEYFAELDMVEALDAELERWVNRVLGTFQMVRDERPEPGTETSFYNVMNVALWRVGTPSHLRTTVYNKACRVGWRQGLR